MCQLMILRDWRPGTESNGQSVMFGDLPLSGGSHARRLQHRVRQRIAGLRGLMDWYGWKGISMCPIGHWKNVR